MFKKKLRQWFTKEILFCIQILFYYYITQVKYREIKNKVQKK